MRLRPRRSCGDVAAAAESLVERDEVEREVALTLGEPVLGREQIQLRLQNAKEIGQALDVELQGR